MKKLLQYLYALGIAAIIGTGCTNDTRGGYQAALPASMGRLNEIFVVADSTLLAGTVGDTFNYYFQAPYLILPQPEPLYDVRHETPRRLSLNPRLKEMKTYVIVADLEDEDSPTTQMIMDDIGPEKRREIKETKGFTVTVGRNKWAGGQMLIYIVGFGEDKLVENIQRSFPQIVKKLNEEFYPKLEATAYQGGENPAIAQELEEKMGVKLKVPGDYVKAIYDEDNQTMWIRRDAPKLNANIMLHKLKYTAQEQLSREGLKEIRNKLGAQYVSTTLDSTYMIVNDIDLPMFVETIEIDDYYALEARGIWEIVNDFMAGPFISYLIHNPNTNELLFIDAFIYAPGEDKRDVMQEMEVILATVDF